ncbi:nitrilase-related carbon-nitrogen hydrolase [Leifsonia sp. SIMBA_070]|uniref:nitrilase-related carbon-nitrogen hydrolase n=1 Tax=Leifsonia sp. SIMBA_070 TaxID=3085810 RepID=UPI00397C7163
METSPASLRVSVVQFEAIPSDPVRDLQIVGAMAEEAAAQGSRLVVFPEMCLLGYWHLTKMTADELFALAEPADGPLVSQVAALAESLGVGIGVGFLELSEGRLFNSYAVCLPDGAVPGSSHCRVRPSSSPRTRRAAPAPAAPMV